MTPSLSVLEDKGIEIEEDPTDIKSLPPYAEDLRQLLLNFKEIVPFSEVWSAFSKLCTVLNVFRLPQTEAEAGAVVQKRQRPLEQGIACEAVHLLRFWSPNVSSKMECSYDFA